MANTYEDTTGNTFSSYDEAKASNLAPITASSLTPTAPITVTQPKPASQADGLSNFLGEMATMTETDRVATLERNASASKDNYLSGLISASGETALTANAYEQAGVNSSESELKDINNQIIAEQRALEKQLRALEKNPEGLFGGALAQEMNKVKGESLERQADLSVIQMAKQGRFDSAKAIADRAVAAKMEGQRNKLDALRFSYEENKELFTKEEQRQFETSQKERERDLDMQEYQEKSRYDQILRQSDPLYQLQVAREQKELSLLGQPTVTERKALESALKESQSSIPVMQDKIASVDLLKTHPGLAASVGPNVFTRPSGLVFQSARQEFIGGIEKMLSGLTLDSLIEAKKRGATFGALSDSELRILASAASSIRTWQVKDKDGNITGYNISEAAFKKELDQIKQFTSEALIRSGQSLFSDDESATLDEYFGGALTPAAYY